MSTALVEISFQQREVYRTSRLLDFASQRELTAQIGH